MVANGSYLVLNFESLGLLLLPPRVALSPKRLRRYPVAPAARQLATWSCSWRYALSTETEMRLAHARTNRRSRVSRTCRQPLRLPGRSARRLQAHNCTRTARDGSISGMAWKGSFEPLTCDLTETHPAPAASIQCPPAASLRGYGWRREPPVRRPEPIGAKPG